MIRLISVLCFVLCVVVSACSSQEYAGGKNPVRGVPGTRAGAETAAKAGHHESQSGALSPEGVSEKLFNVAILTKSVQCLFCHMNIEGDVGGIDFPSDAQMSREVGQGLRILGTLYATNDIPTALSGPETARSLKPNYKNSELRIFPTTKDSSGKTIFPTVTAQSLTGKTAGTLKIGQRVIRNAHTGSLTAVASDSPLEIDGEIHVDGDLIIGGNYRGIGTIYARNIFIVRDLKATNSAFPFSQAEDVAKQQAKERIVSKKDGLFLLSLGQITVGYPDPALLKTSQWKALNSPSSPVTVNLPGMGVASYVALSESKGCTNQDAQDYRKVVVNRVDAFLYASDYLMWRTCGGFELNGGFVTPSVALVNAGDKNRLGASEESSNVVRYDWRLRAGINAFSVLKSFFEQ